MVLWGSASGCVSKATCRRLLTVLSFLFTTVCAANATEYVVGVGKADVTGPVAEVNMMGYAKPEQSTSGIHTRLYARAFLFGDAKSETTRFMFVSVDSGMVPQAVTMEVISRLKVMYGGLYNNQNVALSAIHTHSGPGGYFQYLLYHITSMGFVKQSFDALVDGIIKAISQAHDSAESGRVSVGMDDLLNASINRSPTAYLSNPETERAQYSHDTDKQMTLLKISGDSSGALGALNWFAVHCTSLNNTNQLVSGDNKGEASQFMEKWARKSKGMQNFVAGFAQSNVGDVSPNTLGTYCTDTGLPCDNPTSTCSGKNELCHGRGPGWPDALLSNKIIAVKQFEKAREIYEDGVGLVELSGPIDFRHAFIDLSKISVDESGYGPKGPTCPAAMGFSFAAGTTDGPGAFDFQQGDTSGSKFWKAVSAFLKPPSEEQIKCHSPKPILLNTGELSSPYPWQPSIVDIQILRIGQLVIVCVPGEFTTMAGRRLRAAIYDELHEAWGDDLVTVIAGLTNTYSSYVTTYEEYQVQRYEGASTIFGPHTLQAYIQEFRKLARAMATGTQSPPGPSPPNFVNKLWSFLPPVVLDSAPFGQDYGDVLKGPQKQSFAKQETVIVEFRSANPRNDLRTGGTFLTVEHLNKETSKWDVVLTDDDTDTQFIWDKISMAIPFSTATVKWTIDPTTESGLYRMCHFGNAKKLFGGIVEFSGCSEEFFVEFDGVCQGPVTKCSPGKPLVIS